MYDILIENATVINGKGRFIADIGIFRGRIEHLGVGASGSARERIDGSGKFVIPGLIDTHVHFRDPGHPGKEDWASGSRAAVSGGVTTVCDMPNTRPPTLTPADWEQKRGIAAERSRANYGIWVGASANNLDDARRLADEGQACGIKVFMGASTGPLLVDDATLELFFRHTRALMGVHAEDETTLQRYREFWAGRVPPTHHDARPADAATNAVNKLVALQRAFPRPVHVCHVSTAAELAIIAVVSGELPITTEACPHHLFLNHEAPLGNFGKVNPPIRPESDRRAIWEALRAGLIDSVGSDHAPHTEAEKAGDYDAAPSGMPGVETILPLMLAAVKRGEISLERLVAACCEAPARIFGFNRKGAIEVGKDADLVLLSDHDILPLTTAHLLTRVGWSPFTGHLVAPKPDSVFVLGKRVAANGQIVDDGARGELVTPTRA